MEITNLNLPQAKQGLNFSIGQSADGIFLLDGEGNYLNANAAGCSMMGYEKEELLKLNIESLIPEEDLIASPLKCNELSDGMPLTFERKFIRKNGSVFTAEINSQMLPDGNIQGVVRDISARKQTESLLRKNLHRLETAQRITQSGHFEADLVTGKVIWSNETYRIYACDPNSYQPTLKKTMGFLHPDDISFVHKELELAMSGKKEFNNQHKIINANKETVYVNVIADISFDDSGKVAKLLGTITDITEITRSRQWEALSNKVLKLLVQEAALPSILETMVFGAEQYSPGTICSMVLLAKDGKHLQSGIAPNLPDFYNEAVLQIEVGMGVGSCGTAIHIGKRVIVENIQTHPYWADFREITAKAGLASCWSEPIKDASGKVLGSFAIYHSVPSSPSKKDIELIEYLANLASIVLGRFYASEALRKSEEKYRQLVEQASDGIFIFDSKGDFSDINTSGSRMTGYSKEEIRNLSIRNLIDKEDLANNPLRLKELLQGDHVLLERKIQRKDGSTFDAEISARMPQTGVAHAIMRDITARKKAELALKESENKLAMTFNSSTDMMGLVNYNEKGEFILGTVNEVTKQYFDQVKMDNNVLYGTELKYYCTNYLGLTLEEGMELENNYKRVLSEGKPVKIQGSFKNIEDNTFYYETTLNPVNENDGMIRQVLFVTRDTTESRKAELILKANEKKLALTLDSTIDMMGLMDINKAGEFVFSTANRATKESLKLMQVEEEDYFGTELKTYFVAHLGFTKKQAIEIEEKYQQVVKEKKSVKVSSSSPDPEGNLFYIETTINPVFGEDGSVQQILWVNKDVTEAKKAEEKLLSSEQQLNEAQKIAKIGSWEYNIDTGEVIWSKEQYHIFEMEGTPSDQINEEFKKRVHPDDFPKLEELINKAIEENKGYSFEYRIICKDGNIKHLLVLGKPVSDLQGKVIGLKGTSQDISEKVEAQKQKLQSMVYGEEKERKRFAEELHDGVGQTLSLISLNLDSILDLGDKTSALSHKKLLASLEMVNQTIEDIRSISHGLRPPALKDFGLESVLENVLNKAHLATGITVDFSFGNTVGRCSSGVEINVYRIVQEALNNTLKHANAQNISLKIYKKAAFLYLLYKDDGRGFKFSKNKPSYNGLKNIENRVYILEGDFSLNSMPAKGTCIEIKIPV